MKNILLITNSFPYLPGEEFLETEIKYYKDIKLTIMPINKSLEIREIEKSINLDNFLIDNIPNTKLNKIKSLAQAFLSKVFYVEIFSTTLLNKKKIKSFFASFIKYKNFLITFDTYFRTKEDLKNTIIYTYWNNEATYALQSLRKKYGYKLISRIHRYDIYKEMRPSSYMPLKLQFTKNIDKIYTITESANSYLHDTYNYDMKHIELSRLGVNDYGIISIPNKINIFHIVSCSFLVQVKQIDKIIEALSIVSRKTPNIQYIWTHIGDGPMDNELKELSNDILNNIDNIQYKFKGHLNNKEVYNFYKNTKVDVFINVSASEGVPVSIMEAMSCHIPIIAPDIGGIKDMVINNTNGVLLSNHITVIEITNALEKTKLFKNETIRLNSYNIFLEKYDAKKNYNSFINKIISL